MTATEWLIQQLLAVGRLEIHKNDYILTIIDQAKEIEKQQIIDAHGSKLKKSRGVTNYEYWYTGENYYNDTFKNTNK